MNTLEKLQYQNRSAALLKDSQRFTSGPHLVPMQMSSMSLRFHEDQHSLTWEMEAPGLTKENVHVLIDGGWIVISECGKNNKTQTGRRFFHQTLRIPSTADSAKTKAIWRDGVLEISMMKMKPKTIHRTIPVTDGKPGVLLSNGTSFAGTVKKYALQVKDSFEKFYVRYITRWGYRKLSM